MSWPQPWYVSPTRMPAGFVRYLRSLFFCDFDEKCYQGTKRELWLLGRWSQADCSWGEQVLNPFFFKEMGKTKVSFSWSRWRCLGSLQGAGAGTHMPPYRLSSRLQQHGLPHHWHTHGGKLVILRLNALNLFSFFLFCLSVSLRRYALTIAWKCFQVRLEDQVCQGCKEGQTKLRPGLVQVSLIFP